jgi:hypothetical protein
MILAQRYFVRGSVRQYLFGAAPAIRFGQHKCRQFELPDRGHSRLDINFPDWLKNDVQLISKAAGIEFFHYGPRLWMVGKNEILRGLQSEESRSSVISDILEAYPERVLEQDECFFRLRVNPQDPTDPSQFDSPPKIYLGGGRLDAPDLPLMYASQDTEVCIHECRITIEQEAFLATLRPNIKLRLLDFSEILYEDRSEFDSIDIGIHLLFFAGSHSYDICRAIARAVKHAGYDGLIYPSYFSHVRTGAMPFDTAHGMSVRLFKGYANAVRRSVIGNLALFGYPIAERRVSVSCIERIILNQVKYDLCFGPLVHGTKYY